MAASPTLPEFQPVIKKSNFNRHGVLTLYGYGIDIRVDRGHLLIKDGIGADRYQLRLPRVGHGLRRLVVIGNDGQISLAALRWVSDQKCAFVLLERDGRVLITTGPVRSSDARLRRAQALAEQSGAALVIAKELIVRKLSGQERVAREKLLDEKAAEVIAGYKTETERCETMDAVRWFESQGASAYWAAWHNLPASFPRSDLRRVPGHWLKFATRKSPLTGSQRLAVCPTNAILNFCYALAEAEARLAAATLGLDPGLGFIHVDTPARDSLACDLMEVVRPEIDSFVVDLITRNALRREWLHEERDGNCRLMAGFASRLADTAPVWARAVAPVAEWVARQLWTRQRKSTNDTPPPTRLTQEYKRVVKDALSLPRVTQVRMPSICQGCGKEISRGSRHCEECSRPLQTDRIKAAARAVCDKAHSPEARAKQSQAELKRRKKQAAWSPEMQPRWLTEEVYWTKVQPVLAKFSNSKIATALGISRCSASQVKAAKLRPHPRHWKTLAELTGIKQGFEMNEKPPALFPWNPAADKPPTQKRPSEKYLLRKQPTN